jgi:hypothetical protein
MGDFSQPPVYDPVLNKEGKMANVWEDHMTYNWQTLVAFLSSSGIFPPQLTTAQRNAITAPMNGQMIYNSTTDTPQMFVAGAWKTIVTV